MSVFDPKSSADLLALVRDWPLATLVSNGSDGFAATPLPLLAETDAQGRIVALIGHIARRNPQHDALCADGRAVALFHGPQAYISPRIVSKAKWGATWNYAFARFQVEVKITPERTPAAVAMLAEALEGRGEEAWRPEQMGERYDQLIRHIVAFRATVLSVDARFKLGQDEHAQTFDEIVKAFEGQPLARMMKEQRPK